MTMSSPGSDLQQAAAWLQAADGLLITAGAGMGIDSGLPDFRGPGGFWAAYPALGRARIASNPLPTRQPSPATPL